MLSTIHVSSQGFSAQLSCTSLASPSFVSIERAFKLLTEDLRLVTIDTSWPVDTAGTDHGRRVGFVPHRLFLTKALLLERESEKDVLILPAADRFASMRMFGTGPIQLHEWASDIQGALALSCMYSPILREDASAEIDSREPKLRPAIR